MANLVKCKSCDQPVGRGALVCPNCGEHNPAVHYGRVLLWLFGIAGLLIFALIVAVTLTAPDIAHAKLVEEPENATGRYLFCRDIDQLRELRSAENYSAMAAIGDARHGCQWLAGHQIRDVQFKADGYEPEVVSFGIDDPALRGTDWAYGNWYTWRSNLSEAEQASN